MIGNFPTILDVNRLFLKLNQCICNQTAGSPRSLLPVVFLSTWFINSNIPWSAQQTQITKIVATVVLSTLLFAPTSRHCLCNHTLKVCHVSFLHWLGHYWISRGNYVIPALVNMQKRVPFNGTIWTARKQGHHKTTHDHHHHSDHQHTFTTEDGRSSCAKMMGNVDINPPFYLSWKLPLPGRARLTWFYHGFTSILSKIRNKELIGNAPMKWSVTECLKATASKVRIMNIAAVWM